MDFIVIVPARLGSTRLPRKLLLDIDGAPMVVHVARQAIKSGASRVLVAADSEEILEACARHGVECILTSTSHPTGTDRLAEAVAQLGLAPETIVVNVQGDEPLLPPGVVRDVALLLHARTDCEIATAAHPIADAGEFFSPDVVKVVIDQRDCAITFSRAPIPWSRDAFARDAFAERRTTLPEDLPAWHHVGLYAYRAAFLLRFAKLTPPAIETHEKLEQLRAIAHGIGIVILKLDRALPSGVDTLDDLQRVRALIRG